MATDREIELEKQVAMFTKIVENQTQFQTQQQLFISILLGQVAGAPARPVAAPALGLPGFLPMPFPIQELAPIERVPGDPSENRQEIAINPPKIPRKYKRRREQPSLSRTNSSDSAKTDFSAHSSTSSFCSIDLNHLRKYNRTERKSCPKCQRSFTSIRNFKNHEARCTGNIIDDN